MAGADLRRRGADLPPWPWPPGLAPGWHALWALFAEAAQGHEPTGFEMSCRLAPAGAESARLLRGLAPTGPRAALAALPSRLGLPEAAAQAFTAGLADGHQVFLSVEQGRAGLVAKLYLEWPVPVAVAGPGAEARARPALQMRGWKWPLDPHTARPVPGAEGAARLRTTDYWRWPLARPEAAVALLHGVRGGADDVRATLACAAAALERALARARPGFDTALLLAHEEGSPRASCAVRLHDSGLRADDLRHELALLAGRWGLDRGLLDKLLAGIGPRELGWLAAGAGPDGQGFLTLYADARPQDFPLAPCSVQAAPAAPYQ
ncbi:hypothetical protein [Azohydromonas australica]|uniref:hypothetical protein n=1 Tax=Azohydromonas australica TaxID=364039 RepID=UPI0004214399|nr:hypothetical protein [Azohydromonas australica]